MMHPGGPCGHGAGRHDPVRGGPRARCPCAGPARQGAGTQRAARAPAERGGQAAGGTGRRAGGAHRAERCHGRTHQPAAPLHRGPGQDRAAHRLDRDAGGLCQRAEPDRGGRGARQPARDHPAQGQSRTAGRGGDPAPRGRGGCRGHHPARHRRRDAAARAGHHARAGDGALSRPLARLRKCDHSGAAGRDSSGVRRSRCCLWSDRSGPARGQSGGPHGRGGPGGDLLLAADMSQAGAQRSQTLYIECVKTIHRWTR